MTALYQFDASFLLENVQRRWDPGIAVRLLEEILKAISEIEDGAWPGCMFQLELPELGAVGVSELVPDVAGPFGHFVNHDVQRSACWKTLGLIGSWSAFHHDLAGKNHMHLGTFIQHKNEMTSELAAGAFVVAFFAGDAESAA